MASITIMIGGAALNAATFIGGNYLTRSLTGGDKALEEKKRHDRALEAYQAAYAKYTRDHTKLLDWIATNTQIKEQVKQNFTNTDYAFKLNNQAHPDRPMVPPKEPQFSDFYQPSEEQKQGKLLFVLLHWGPLRFISFELVLCLIYGFEACGSLLQPTRLLERHRCNKKISRNREGS